MFWAACRLQSRVFSDAMGRAGIEPATLGLKVGARLLWWLGHAGRNAPLRQISRMFSGALAQPCDLLLTHLVSCIDNARGEVRGEVTRSLTTWRWRGRGATVLLVRPHGVAEA
jgi:hypothetical protein